MSIEMEAIEEEIVRLEGEYKQAAQNEVAANNTRVQIEGAIRILRQLKQDIQESYGNKQSKKEEEGPQPSGGSGANGSDRKEVRA